MSNMPLHLQVNDPNMKVIVEGYMKKIRNILMSKKSYYKVIDTNMFISSAPDKEFTLKYDLTNYILSLS